MAGSSARPPRRRSSLAGEHPAWPAAVPDSTPEPEAPAPQPAVAQPSEPTASSTAPAEAPMPAPRRRRLVRVQLNTRVRQDLHERLQTFVGEHDAAVQDVIEVALEEYLDRRASS